MLADELRIARFDAARVFDQYQHTKEVGLEISAKRQPNGPGSYSPELDELAKRERRLAEVTEKVKRTAAGSPERERLEQEERIASIERRIAEIKLEAVHGQRFEESSEKTQIARSKILEEIEAEARSLATERGYALIVPENWAAQGFVGAIVNPKWDDVTEVLLERLNQKYKAKH
jgi:Skp family chaperone for outer membrane proteins